MICKEIEPILSQYPGAGRDALIPILQEVQESMGYLSKDAIMRIGEFLNLPSSKIYGVATFYNQFRFQPLGRFHVQVCRGTACHVKGSAKVLDAMVRELKINPGQTTRDGLFSLEVVACIGLRTAPVISVNGEFFAGSRRENQKILNSFRRKRPMKIKSSGQKVCEHCWHARSALRRSD
jgi:NADH-quinone oxidoreductase subunit E